MTDKAAAENRWRLALEAAGDGVWEWNIQTGEAYFSWQYKEMLGYAGDEIWNTADEWSKRTHPDDLTYVMSAVQAYLEGNSSSALVDYRMRCKDGGWKWVRGRGMMVSRDGEGRPLRLIGTNTDITEQKQIEAGLRESYEAYRSILTTTLDGFWRVSPQGRFLDVNSRYAEQSGYAREELLGMGITDVEAIERPEDTAAHIQTIIERGRHQFESMHRRKDGSTWHVEVSATFRDVGGGQFFVFLRDINERKQALQAVQASEAWFRSIFENTNTGIASTDRNGRIVSFNEAFRAIVGYDAETLARMSLGELTHPDDLQSELVFFNEILTRQREKYRITKRYIAQDGRWIWVDISVGAIRDAQGEVVNFVGVVQDVSEIKNAEADLRIAAAAFEAQESITITDAGGTILRVNQAFTTITGFSASQVVGQNPRILQSGRHDKQFYVAMWESILHNGSWKGEIWNRRKNAEIYPALLTITAVVGSDGNVTHYVGTSIDISASKAAEDEIRQLAFYDPLTHLPNRRLMLDRLAQALAGCARHGRQGALMLIDLDNFKTLNDTRGHHVGDRLLREVAARLEASIREGDTAARLGGDEFVIILKDLEETDAAARHAEQVAQKIQFQLNQPYLLDPAPSDNGVAPSGHHCSSSIGITLFYDQSIPVEELMRRADTAMYQAKASGRNTLRFFDPDMQAAVAMRALLESDLHKAVLDSQFVLYYQPQISSTGHVIGAEALVRWQHPERGLVSPAEFIPLAEETGLILPLGYWVMENACKALAGWSLWPNTAHISVAVNVSARQFSLPNFVDQVLAMIKHTGAPADKLKLELTESLLLGNAEDLIAKMTALKTHGVGFAMDDFGTGYSSLANLKRLPLDQLKIDQSFIRHVLSEPNDAAIAKTIVALGHSLGLNVIAEGVETQGQRDFLANHGCYAYQGYLFSRPVSLEGFEAFLKRN